MPVIREDVKLGQVVIKNLQHRCLTCDRELLPIRDSFYFCNSDECEYYGQEIEIRVVLQHITSELDKEDKFKETANVLDRVKPKYIKGVVINA